MTSEQPSSTSTIHTRAPKGPNEPIRRFEGDDMGAFLKDAASTPGGHAALVAEPNTEAQVAALIKGAQGILAIGAQSSLTGGATPFGELVLRSDGFADIGPVTDQRLRVGAGVALMTLQETLRAQGFFYPPVPTYDGAYVGGVVATNAAGAQTFKYGSTRDWVEALTVILANGEVLDIRRGEVKASAEGFTIIDLAGQAHPVPLPRYQLPKVPKCSAGYFAAPGMDLIDLFIGSEGTLGFVTELELRCLPLAFEELSGFVSVATEAQGVALSKRLRDASQASWRGQGSGLDVPAIESLDQRSLALLRADGQDKRSGVELPEDHHFALFFRLELPKGFDDERISEELEAFLEGEPGHPALAELFEILSEFDALDTMEVAMPGDERRATQLFELRDRVPVIVNHMVADAQREGDARIHKTAADMCVPWEHFAEMQALYQRGFEERGLDYAIWGHISDGNVHPNVIPQSYDDVVKGKEAILEFGRRVAELGGSPLAEHGVGRNPMKQGLLEQLYGASGIAEMKAVKRALDPDWKFAPGVIFQP